MRKSWFLALALSVGMGCASPVLADKDKDKDKHKDNHQAERDRDRDDGRWERREGYEYRSYERDQRPPGWSRGKKTGWGNCGVPPGQAKKGGCRTYTHNGRQHYYYQDSQGRIFVRRPTADQDHDHDRR